MRDRRSFSAKEILFPLTGRRPKRAGTWRARVPDWGSGQTAAAIHLGPRVRPPEPNPAAARLVRQPPRPIQALGVGPRFGSHLLRPPFGRPSCGLPEPARRGGACPHLPCVPPDSHGARPGVARLRMHRPPGPPRALLKGRDVIVRSRPHHPPLRDPPTARDRLDEPVRRPSGVAVRSGCGTSRAGHRPRDGSESVIGLSESGISGRDYRIELITPRRLSYPTAPRPVVRCTMAFSGPRLIVFCCGTSRFRTAVGST